MGHEGQKTSWLQEKENPPNIGGFCVSDGGSSATRTPDALIKSQVLYQLS
jgi:hypothetical protein